MKKNLAIIMMALVLMIVAQGALAEDFAAERSNALAAVKVSLPDAVVDYAVRERDDGRYEWNLFFVHDGRLGMGEVVEPDFSVRRVQFYDMENALTAPEIVEALMMEKGEIRIVDLELDHDDGRLRYEGVAEQSGKRYEFELSVSGKIIEWERD